jgi:hypothetical protein
MTMHHIPRRSMLKAGGAAFAAFGLPLPLLADSAEPGDELLLHEVKLLEEIDNDSYRELWSNLRNVTEEELDWKLHPEANTLRWVVGHLNWFEEWVGDAIDGTGMYLEEKGGPTSFQERPLERMKARFDAARERSVASVRSLTPDDLRRKIRFVYNEANDQRWELTLRDLLQIHTTHLSGHRYQVRYIRGTYSRAHGTDKARFDAW